MLSDVSTKIVETSDNNNNSTGTSHTDKRYRHDMDKLWTIRNVLAEVQCHYCFPDSLISFYELDSLVDKVKHCCYIELNETVHGSLNGPARSL